MTAYPFPGNVRELENEIERAIAMAEHGEHIGICHLSEKFQNKQRPTAPGFRLQGTLKEMVETLEKEAVSQMLEKHQGNKTLAAKELGLSRYGLMKMIHRYHL